MSASISETHDLPHDGLVAVVKRDCPTCVLVSPVLGVLSQSDCSFRVLSQDDPFFPETVKDIGDDRPLEASYQLGIETVPTLIRFKNGVEAGRCIGWNRAEWQDLCDDESLGADLPENRPGCGSLSVEPGAVERLEALYGDSKLASRQIELDPYQDDIEAAYDRGWSDGLPVVPPTPERVLRMLGGTSRAPGEVLGLMPPDLVPLTVEKVAINAVMAGCKPEYMPVVLAVMEAALINEFGLHGLICTTMFGSPVVIVNGPVTRRIGMNSGGNAMGQGNRANATIGRTIQLIIRNVGGGRPGEIDRSCLGNPGKYTFCFAEDEEGSSWESLAVERGIAEGRSAVTLFPGEGVQSIVDQKSRTPESLARTFAACLRVVDHPKLPQAGDAILVVSPEHERVFREAGWSKARLKEELNSLLMLDGAELVTGAGGIAEGIPAHKRDETIPKFRDGGLLIVRAGGVAGLFSGIITGWAASGPSGSIPVTKEVTE